LASSENSKFTVLPWPEPRLTITLLIPAFIVAEATLSYIGLGFPSDVASWGTMLRDAANVQVFADFPWLLSPAVAMFAVVLGLNLALQDHATGVESVR
jgi:ABC-type dipeptide/oligopeptide/nickel transport system permease subunit